MIAEYLMAFGIWLFSLCTIWQSAAGDVKVSSPTRASATGQLQQVTGDGISFESSNGLEELALSEVSMLEFRDVKLDDSRTRIELRDGSNLIVDRFELDDTTLAASEPALTVVLPTKFVKAVQLIKLSEDLQAQWQEITTAKLEADTLVINRGEGGLDKIEGLITGMADNKLGFEFNGQAIEVPISRLAGFAFFGDQYFDVKKPVAVLQTVHGSQLTATKLELKKAGSEFDVELQDVVSAEVKLAETSSIDFSIGSVKYLAEMRMATRSSRSRLKLATEIPGVSSFFGPRVIRQLSDGRPLPPSIEFLGSGDASFDVPQDYTKLGGSVELTPPGNRIAPCRVQVLIERKVVWEKVLKTRNQRVDFELAVEPGSRLRLKAAPMTDTAVGDVVLWRGVRLLK